MSASDALGQQFVHHTELINGNHRVAAMTQIGYDKPVKVRVTDERTKR